jgi:hypothetical protein
MDSAFYGAPAYSAARTAGACFSVTVRIDPKVRAAIGAIAAQLPFTLRSLSRTVLGR